ncbi:MAG: hypothetical protein E7550_04765 [Ruminococcaceae bacterium]|nr:hypothetical protein [Oscillospiraceae bacterium]
MKKLLSVLLVICVLAAVLCACGGGDAEDKETFKCAECKEEFDGKGNELKVDKYEVTVCDDCYDELMDDGDNSAEGSDNVVGSTQDTEKQETESADSLETAIVGTWKEVGGTETLIIDADGSIYMEDEDMGLDGEYRISGGKFILTAVGGIYSDSMDIEINGDTMFLGEFEYKRVN